MGRIQETITAYLELLEQYTDEQVEAACRRLSCEAREFPPSRGEVRTMVEKIVAATCPRRERLPDYTRPSAALSEAEREANKAKLDALLGQLRGNIQNAPPDRAAVKPRPAPFNMGAPLMKSLMEKGLAKPPVTEEEDPPSF